MPRALQVVDSARFDDILNIHTRSSFKESSMFGSVKNDVMVSLTALAGAMIVTINGELLLGLVLAILASIPVHQRLYNHILKQHRANQARLEQDYQFRKKRLEGEINLLKKDGHND